VSKGVRQAGNDPFSLRDKDLGRKSGGMMVGHGSDAIIALIAGGRASGLDGLYLRLGTLSRVTVKELLNAVVIDAALVFW